MDHDELRHALGSIVLAAAHLERVLRPAFSALVGSKYAAVVDARLSASALIEDCERITSQHTVIPAAAKPPLLAALKACHEVNRERNRMIHDAWATRPDSMAVDEVRRVADRLAGIVGELNAAMTAALGPEWVLVEDQLRQELGHDVRQVADDFTAEAKSG